jgi:hypothetical protein
MDTTPRGAEWVAAHVEDLLECSREEELLSVVLDAAVHLGAALPVAILALNEHGHWQVRRWRGVLPEPDFTRVRARLQAGLDLDGSGWRALSAPGWRCVLADNVATSSCDALEALLQVARLLAGAQNEYLFPPAPLARRRERE